MKYDKLIVMWQFDEVTAIIGKINRIVTQLSKFSSLPNTMSKTIIYYFRKKKFAHCGNALNVKEISRIIWNRNKVQSTGKRKWYYQLSQRKTFDNFSLFIVSFKDLLKEREKKKRNEIMLFTESFPSKFEKLIKDQKK